MFISSFFLTGKYGVDDKIATFFADREPPVNNLYWKGKLLYLRPSPGYLFIPLIVDLFFKLGINKQQLLSEQFVGAMEQIGHICALEETGQISVSDAIKLCSDLVKSSCRNKEWHSHLFDFLNNGNKIFFDRFSTPFKALHRGDVFLFSVCKLEFTNELGEKLAEHWFALISILLLLDDAEDIETDQETGEVNAFLESGLNTAGVKNILEWVDKSLTKIETINSSMAHQLHEQFTELLNQPHILKYLN